MSQAPVGKRAIYFSPLRRITAAIALVCALTLLLAPPAQGQAVEPEKKVALTAAETAFLRQHPTILLGTEASWAPYVLVGPHGEISGYDADILNRVNALTGANFQLVLGRWRDMLDAAKQRRIDGLSTSAMHEEREDHLSFSDVYISLRKMLLVAKGNPAEIHSTQDLTDKTLAIHRGNLADEKLALEMVGAELMLVDSVEDSIRAVISGEADATFGNGATLFVANRIGLPYLELGADLGKRLNLVFSVRKDWPEALSVLNKGLAAIPEHERLLIQSRWFGNATVRFDSRIALTAEERRHLLAKDQVRLCIDPQWMPYERLDDDGTYQGVIADIHYSLAKRLDIDLEIVPTTNWSGALDAARDRRCDLMSAAAATPERASYLSFTQPFMDVPLVLATREEHPFIDSVLDVSDETFAVIRSHALQDIFRRRYPGIKLIEVDSPFAGLEVVRKEQAFGFIDTGATISYAIRKHDLIEVKISGKLEERYELAVGVRSDDPLLLSIYNKALKALPRQEIERAISRWTSMETVTEIDRGLLLKILGALGIIGLLLLYRYRVIAGYNRRLEDVNRQLQTLSETDQLTGVSNRRRFTDVIANEIARVERYGGILALIISDIDDFKTINDNCGHDAGDRVLTQFARLFTETSRSVDLVVRWGGEEFLVLCPQTDLAAAERLAELLRQRVAGSDFGIGQVITSSFGVAEYQPPEHINDLIARADRALYRAKAEGRNRVSTQSPQNANPQL